MYTKEIIYCLTFGLFFVSTLCWGQSPHVDLWDSAIPYPALTEIPTATGVTYSIVHQQTPDHHFLHEPRVTFHGETLFVNFSNAEKNESDPDQKIRGHRSNDGGRTWNDVEVFAPGFSDSRRHETAPLLSSGNKLWSFVGRYNNGSKNSLGMELFRLSENGKNFEPFSGELVLERFIPFVQPQLLSNGNWIIGGHTEKVRHAAVAISEGNDLTKWKEVKIETPACSDYPETALLLQDQNVLAVVRGCPSQRALIALSTDFGETFPPLTESNLPMSQSKPFGGTLSTGQHYLIYNANPSRNTLVIAVTKPNELIPLRKVFKVIEGLSASMQQEFEKIGEKSKINAWAYPEAVEKNGILYIVFSFNKKHCVLARIPVESLKY
ncbi:MAG: exo-alpha-sialidase [Planctomycetaceae bacterium]|jgi:hypothetical protein|nr:exo-alpha-sialidase [Planctomycetaceae bacterium]